MVSDGSDLSEDEEPASDDKYLRGKGRHGAKGARQQKQDDKEVKRLQALIKSSNRCVAKLQKARATSDRRAAKKLAGATKPPPAAPTKPPPTAPPAPPPPPPDALAMMRADPFYSEETMEPWDTAPAPPVPWVVRPEPPKKPVVHPTGPRQLAPIFLAGGAAKPLAPHFLTGGAAKPPAGKPPPKGKAAPKPPKKGYEYPVDGMYYRRDGTAYYKAADGTTEERGFL